MFSLKSLLDRLTDNYNKDPSSKIGKLLTILSEQLQDVGESLNLMEDWRNIDNAKGTTLDRIGKIMIQPRGVATDEVYRIMLKSKIAQSLSTGDINTVIIALAVTLDAEPSEIIIEEMYNDPTEPEPSALKILDIPLSKINEAGMSPGQFARIVQRTVAAGVRVGIIEMTGTFAFGDQVPEVVPFVYGSDSIDSGHTIDPDVLVPDTLEGLLELLLGVEIRDGSIFVPEFDPNAGFADIDGTIGGYFGAVFLDVDDEDLPI